MPVLLQADRLCVTARARQPAVPRRAAVLAVAAEELEALEALEHGPADGKPRPTPPAGQPPPANPAEQQTTQTTCCYSGRLSPLTSPTTAHPSTAAPSATASAPAANASATRTPGGGSAPAGTRATRQGRNRAEEVLRQPARRVDPMQAAAISAMPPIISRRPRRARSRSFVSAPRRHRAAVHATIPMIFLDDGGGQPRRSHAASRTSQQPGRPYGRPAS
jgi:hypothetical protein